MPHARKRLRDNAVVPLVAPSSSATFRATLASRSVVDELPGAWRTAAAAVGVSGADAYLCHLGRSIADALRSIPLASEAARIQLRSSRAALLAGVNARWDELDARVTAAESAKITALERELCTVDAALERLRAERGAAAKATVSLGDAELVLRHAELRARIDAADAQLLTLPTTIVEPPYVGLTLDTSALLAGIAVVGRVVAPRAVTAADLNLEDSPCRTWPGGTVDIFLTLKGAQHASQSAEELEVSLFAVAKATNVEVSHEALGVAPQPLVTENTSADISGRCVIVSIAVPAAAPVGSSVCIHAVTVSGQPAGGFVRPLRIAVQCGMQAPLRLDTLRACYGPASLCISSAGQLFFPNGGDDSRDVLVFDCDGTALPDFSVTGLQKPRYVAFAHGASPSLLLVYSSATSTQLVAVDPANRVARWDSAPGLFQGCCGIAALPDDDIVVAASNREKTLFSLRLSDGERVGSLKVPSLHWGLVADPASKTVFGVVLPPGAGKYAVVRFSWTLASGLRAEGVVAAAWEGGIPLLAVVPPAAGNRGVSHLVIGCTSDLLVLSLPSLVLVHTHRLEGMTVDALAADPWGNSLAVVDSSANAIHVLTWPLPGMPALE